MDVLQSENNGSRFQMYIEVSRFEVMLALHHLACLLFSYLKAFDVKLQALCFLFCNIEI
jgi:hypothetical protein